jgi:heme oxygenase (mycobilin-producing)
MLGTFHTIWTFNVSDVDTWKSEVMQAMYVLQARPGFVSGSVFHNADSPERYLVKTDWLDVGSYRRALGSMEAKVGVWPFLADMRDEPTAFEMLMDFSSESVIEYKSSVNDDLKSD